MRAFLLILAAGVVLAGCGSGGEVTSDEQAAKAKALDKISKSGPGGDKVQQ